MLTCSGSCGSGYGSLSYKDCVVQSGEPVVSDRKWQSDTSSDIFMHPWVFIIQSYSHRAGMLCLSDRMGVPLNGSHQIKLSHWNGTISWASCQQTTLIMPLSTAYHKFSIWNIQCHILNVSKKIGFGPCEVFCNTVFETCNKTENSEKVKYTMSMLCKLPCILPLTWDRICCSWKSDQAGCLWGASLLFCDLSRSCRQSLGHMYQCPSHCIVTSVPHGFATKAHKIDIQTEIGIEHLYGSFWIWASRAVSSKVNFSERDFNLKLPNSCFFPQMKTKAMFS